LRMAIKDQMQNDRVQRNDDARSFDEISRLNNELITLQRDLAKKNAELERLYAEVQNLAITDPLTGLYNRRGFYVAGKRELERSRRYGHPLTAISFDLDHFKGINDSYGHAMGDRVLKEVAERCGTQIRKVDIFGRLGGDEFSILLIETGKEAALKLIDRIRTVMGQPIEEGSTRVEVTLSIGAAELNEQTSTLDGLLLYADKALYQSKEAGRNRAHFYQG